MCFLQPFCNQPLSHTSQNPRDRVFPFLQFQSPLPPLPSERNECLLQVQVILVIQLLHFQQLLASALPRTKPRGAQWTPATPFPSTGCGLFPSPWGCIPLPLYRALYSSSSLQDPLKNWRFDPVRRLRLHSPQAMAYRRRATFRQPILSEWSVLSPSHKTLETYMSTGASKISLSFVACTIIPKI